MKKFSLLNWTGGRLVMLLCMLLSVPAMMFADDSTSSKTAYKIWNYGTSSSSNVLVVSNNRLAHMNDSYDDYTKYWNLVEQSDGTKALYNLATGLYVQAAGKNNVAYTMDTIPYGFNIKTNSKKSTYTDIQDGKNSYGLNAASHQNGVSGNYYNVYSWSFYDGANDPNSAWKIEEVTLSDADISGINNQKVLVAAQEKLAKGVIRIKTRRSNGYYITDNAAKSGNSCRLMASKATTNALYWNQVWIAEPSGNGYTLRNLKTGKYLAPYSTSATSEVYYFYVNQDNAAGEEYINFSTNETQSGNGIHYQENGNVVVEWSMSAGAGSDWLIEDVSDVVSATDIKAQLAKLDNVVSSPEEGKYYVIKNVSNDNAMTDSYSDGLGTVVERDAESYSQLWRLVPVANKTGYYNLQNALTGNYVQFSAFNTQNKVSSKVASGGFKLSEINDDASKYHSYFAFLCGANKTGTSYSLHRSGERLLTWTSYTSANDIKGSIWYFQSVDIPDSVIEAAQAQYQANKSETTNASTYQAALSTFFADKACTTLNATFAGYSDEALKDSMAGAGITSTVLQEMAVKIKNNSWAKWEKEFRVTDLQPHSDPQSWYSQLKNSNIYCTVPNPTGIVVNTDGLAYIFVGADIPKGCSMNVHVVSKADAQGSETSLSSGLNIVPVSKTGALFINYIVPTTMDDDSKRLADFESIPVHVEGGWVNGYFDLNRTEIGTNDAWKQMKSDGLFTYDFMQMKGNYVMMDMTTSYVKQYVGNTQMEQIVGFWDWLTKTEQDLMGVSQYRDRWNDMMGCYSTTTGYMYATSYGTYFNENTLSTVLDYPTMEASGGSLWGPAHEMGHNHQNLINTIGSTEISNNLFSEVAVFKNGKTSTRSEGKSITDLANHYAAGDTWISIQSDNWIPTRMYYQLYLYYEEQGNHPNFWAEVFAKLRKDGINKSGSESNPAKSTNDFLKLAVTCCDVAQEDLSEFFQAYCMFIPFATTKVEDYSTYYIQNTQAMINQAKAKMQKYPKKSGNILFVEDHVKQLDAVDHDGNLTGAKRGDYSSTDAVGKLGDVGSFTDYVDGNYASGYTYAYSNGKLTMSSTEGTASESGAVGYKVYDSEGNLLYFSNKNTFTLPSSVIKALNGADPVVKAAQADGTDVTLIKKSADNITLKVYRANSLSSDKASVVYTDGTVFPEISGNDIVYIVTDGDVPSALSEKTNYVVASNNSATSIVLSDTEEFYAPSDITAANVTYTRSDAAGWNSVCLPFAVTAADFGEGSVVEQYGSLSANGDTLIFTASEGEIAAGVPFIVYSPTGAAEWSISKANATIAAAAQTVTNGNVSLVGTYTAQALGDGKYTLNTSGMTYEAATSETTVPEFRCYVLANEAQAAGTKTLFISHSSALPTGINGAKANKTDNGAYYDLNGIRIINPTKGGIYIHNGKKIILK